MHSLYAYNFLIFPFLTLFKMTYITPTITDLSATQAGLKDRLIHKMNQKTKPLGSLGLIEKLAIDLALINGQESIELHQPKAFIFAADHGLCEQGVSAFPQEVTWQMVENFLAGGAAISVLCKAHGIDMVVVDCGVKHEFGERDNLINLKVAHGSANSFTAPAMTAQECQQALENGQSLIQQYAGNVVLLGEMGIGNTSAAALLQSRLTGLDIASCTGAGTGLDSAAIDHKTAVLAQVLQQHLNATSPLDCLAAMGGLEIATMVGAILQAASLNKIIVVDGFITSSAVLVASKINPLVLQRCIFSHQSDEKGHKALLASMAATPLLQLGLRLGEGSGAALAWPLLVSAAAIMNNMASFESAGVSEKSVD